MRKIIVSLGHKENLADIVRVKQLPWEKFAAFLLKEPKVTEDKASQGWYCPAHFEPAYRHGKNLIARHALTFDYDKIDPDDVQDIRDAYEELEFVIHTSASHTDENPRIRLVLPLSRPVDAEEFACITRTIADRYDINKLARESDKPAQMMFLPTRRPDGEFWGERNEGEWIDVEEVLGEYDDWRDRSKWPTRRERDSVYSRDNVQPPDTKPGIVGDFCRAFRITDAIYRFDLPYEKGSADDRFTYREGSRPDGLRLYDDDKKAQSEHDTDPAHGQTNAFDLTRLHKFGNLDSDVEEGTVVTDLPSYKAMCDLALSLPEVQALRLESEFENLDEGKEREPDEKRRTRFEVIPAPLFSSNIKIDWLIKNVLPRAELAVVYGQSGTGKSFLVLDMCAAIARGADWRDHISTVGRVVYVCAEGARGFRQRIQAYSHTHGVELDQLGIVGDAPNLLDEKDAADITKAVVEFGDVDLVVVDTLSASIPGGDENAGKDMNKLVNHCKFIHKKTGALVLLVHHSGKDASKGARGWSGLRAASDAEIEVNRNGDFRTATLTKLKDGVDGKGFSFKLKTVMLGLDDDGDEVTSCVIEHTDDPKVQKPLYKPSGTYAKAVLDAASNSIQYGDTIELDELITVAVDRVPAVEKGKRDTRKQNISRAIQKLVVDGHLYMHDGNRISHTSAEPVEDWNDG